MGEAWVVSGPARVAGPVPAPPAPSRSVCPPPGAASEGPPWPGSVVPGLVWSRSPLQHCIAGFVRCLPSVGSGGWRLQVPKSPQQQVSEFGESETGKGLLAAYRPLALRGEGPAPSAPVGGGVGWGLLENPCPGFSGWVSRAVPPARLQTAPSGPEQYGQPLLAAGPCPARARRSRRPAPARWPPALQWTSLPISGRGEGRPGCGVTGQEGPPGSRKLATSDTSCSDDLVTHGLHCWGLELRGQRRRAGPAGGRQMLSPAGAGLGPRPGGPMGSWSSPALPPRGSPSSPLGASTRFAARRGVCMGSGPGRGRGCGHLDLEDPGQGQRLCLSLAGSSGPERGPATWSLTGPPPSTGMLRLPQGQAGAAMPLPPAQLHPDWQPVVQVSHWWPLVSSQVASDHGTLGCLCLMVSDFVSLEEGLQSTPRTGAVLPTASLWPSAK